MISAPFYELMRSRLAAAVDEANTAAKIIDHPALAGAIREIAARNLIEPFLTHSFRCGTGKIIDTTGHKTKQIDLIVYNTRFAPVLMLNNAVSIFPVECCSHAIEVKSTLTTAELRSALEVAGTVQALKGFPSRSEPPAYAKFGLSTVLLAFSSNLKKGELERFLRIEVKNPPRFVVLIVLGRGYWFWTKEGWVGTSLADVADPALIYAAFIAGLTNTLAEKEMTFMAFSPGAYMLPYDILAKPVKPVSAS